MNLLNNRNINLLIIQNLNTVFMEFTSIPIKNSTREELKKLQSIYKIKSLDELLKVLIIDSKIKNLDKFSEAFKEQLKEKNLTLEDIVESGEEIRKEIFKEKND